MSYLIVVLAILVPIVVAGIICIPFFLQWLAEENILFTTVREGTAKAVVRGKSFERFLMSFEGYHLNDPKKRWYKSNHPEWEVIHHGEGNRNRFTGNEMRDEFYDDRSSLLKHLGLYWVGWPWANSVHVYAFEWNETFTDKKTGGQKVLPRAEATDFIFVSDFTYAIVTEGAETNDRLLTDELTLVTVAVRNPYRSLFSGEDWMRRVTAAINRHVRNFVGSKIYQELIAPDGSDTTTGWTEFSAPIIKLSEWLPDDIDGRPPFGLHGRYGVEIRTADLQTMELSGEAKNEHQKAAARVYTATQEAEATRLTGQAEADVIEKKGSKEAKALEERLAIIEKYGDAGITLAGYDAIQESSKGPGNTIIWANNPLNAVTDAIKILKRR